MKETVSLILPVYNVADYLDRCMESVVSQTYRNLEILLINDGSTDSSAEKCREWERKDPRIVFIDKENEGVAKTRNLGVDLAKGEVLGFVDPDDWLEPDYVEKLLSRMQETGAEYVECDLWRYNNRNGSRIYRSCGSRMGVPYTLEEHMKYGPTALYKALSRKSLWDRNRIRIPSVSFESPAVYSLILALAEGTAYVPEALYWYRRFRPESLVETGYAAKDGTANNTLGIDAMRFLVHEFQRCGLYSRYRDVLEGVVKYRLSDILAMQFHRKNPEDFRELVRNCRSFLEEQFPEGDNQVYLCWGSYTLNRILVHLDILQDPFCRFSFSSMVSLLEPAKDTPAVRHPNRYREMMINREIQQDFCRIPTERKPQTVFIDLMEERFSLLEWHGRYLTDSDALQGSDSYTAFCSEGRRIPAGSEEKRILWQRAFERFLDLAGRQTKVIVIRTLLSERKGDLQSQEEYANIADIREANRILDGYYRYIEENHPEIPVMETTDLQEYFTDRNYEYGALPQHLNEIVNQKIAGRIHRLLSGKHAEYKEET